MELRTPADPFVGRTLQDRYRVLKKLGEGGMGAVYAGEHTLIKRPVALKVLLPQYAQNGEIVSRFLQEATLVTQLRHEHIVDVTDMGQLDDGSLYMVQELLQGRDFGHLIDDEGPQPIARVAHVVSQVCDGLEAAHPGIVHRDLKPENIFLVQRKSDPYFVKILDFGISKIVGADASIATERPRTKTGAALGTLYYMSPEQATGAKTLDHRTDVYALGAILFRALTARFAFDGETMIAVIMKIMTEPPPSPGSIRGDVPAELDAIVLRCMSKDPAERFQTCAELRAALAPFLNVAQSGPLVGRAGASAAAAASASRASDHPAAPPRAPTPATMPLSADAPATGPLGAPSASTSPLLDASPSTGAASAARATPLPAPAAPSASRVPLYVALAIGVLALLGTGSGIALVALSAGDDPPAPPARSAAPPVATEPAPPTPTPDEASAAAPAIPSGVDPAPGPAATEPPPIEPPAPAAPPPEPPAVAAERPRADPARPTRRAPPPTPERRVSLPPPVPAPLPPAPPPSGLGGLGQGGVRRIP